MTARPTIQIWRSSRAWSATQMLWRWQQLLYGSSKLLSQEVWGWSTSSWRKRQLVSGRSTLEHSERVTLSSWAAALGIKGRDYGGPEEEALGRGSSRGQGEEPDQETQVPVGSLQDGARRMRFGQGEETGRKPRGDRCTGCRFGGVGPHRAWQEENIARHWRLLLRVCGGGKCPAPTPKWQKERSFAQFSSAPRRKLRGSQELRRRWARDPLRRSWSAHGGHYEVKNRGFLGVVFGSKQRGCCSQV